MAESKRRSQCGGPIRLVAVLSGIDLTPIQQVEGTNAGDFFGSHVAGEGDFNGDMLWDVLGGAPDHDGSGGPNSGQARAFDGLTAAGLFSKDGTS